MKFLKLIYVILFLVFIDFTALAQSNPEVDSIFAEKIKLPDDTNKVNILNDLAWFCVNNTYLSSAYKISMKSYTISKQLKFSKGIAYSTKSIAATFFYKGDYDRAQKFYEESFKYFLETGDKKGISVALRNLGNIYHQLGNYKAAIDYYFKSLKIREEIDDKKGIAAVYGAIGLVYVEQGKKERKSALEYFKKALKIEEELGNKTGTAEKYLYIGNIYYENFKDSKSQKSLSDTALIYFKKSEQICVEIENYYYLAMVYEALGSMFAELWKTEESYNYYKKSLDLHQKLENKFGMASVYYSIGLYFSSTDKFKAEQYFMNSYKISKEIGVQTIEMESSAELVKIFAAKKDFKNAFTFQQRFISLKDSLQNKENTKKMTQLAMQFEFDKKEKLQQLEKQKREELYKANLSRQKMTTYFFVAGFAFMIVFAFFVYRSFKQKQRANILLEEKNIEINAQKEEIEQQRDYAVMQKEIIAEQHKHITDSIVYAQRIQQAVLPPQEVLDALLSEYFILYKPRDIVSGDYYWATKKNEKIIITAADCTGHGVPGAFMSLLGTSFLNEIVNKIDTTAGREIIASEILDELRTAVKTSLRQTGKDTDAKDGMDMSLCVIDFPNMKLQFAGANNPMLMVRNNKLIKYHADRMPVGIHYKAEGNFTNTEIDIQKGDAFYLFSDGYIDQFGGEEGRKFMIKRFGELVLNQWQKPMNEQKEIFDQVIIEWQNHKNLKGENFRQIDDILVFAFRV